MVMVLRLRKGIEQLSLAQEVQQVGGLGDLLLLERDHFQRVFSGPSRVGEDQRQADAHRQRCGSAQLGRVLVRQAPRAFVGHGNHAGK